MSDLLLKAFDNEKAANLPTVQIGDNVTVYVRINVGDKNERVQMVRGTIIRVRNAGNNANFTVRRIASNGIGVERTFLANSPRIEKIDVPVSYTHLDVYKRQGLEVLLADYDQRYRVLRHRLRVTDILIDALLGTGVTRPIEGQLAALLEQVLSLIHI